MAGNSWILVAAIDFGTTYSGYAFSFKDKPMDLQSPQTWYAGTTQLASLKTPTCLLLNADQTFQSFGYEAQNKYATLAGDDAHHDVYFFERFKMFLHHAKNITRQSEIEDINGKSVQALLVFTLSIRYLKDHLMKTLSDRVKDVRQDDVRFVLTVPAIWEESSKQFMREAAIKAGIKTEKLLIALEPEAASLYCQRIPVDRLSCGQDVRISDVGTQYLVADIGGGTADFSVHEKEVGGTLKELHKASGGPHGGIYVDLEYNKIFQNTFGNDSLERLKMEDMGDYLDLFRDFETKKRTVSKEFEGNYVVRLPASLVEIAKDNNIDFQTLTDKVKIMRDKMKIEASVMKSLFAKSISSIILHIERIIRKFPDVKHIILVGGYGECSILQSECKERFKKRNIVIPSECGLAVVRGAVLYGHNPLTISSRIMRYTYGVNHNVIFKPGIHPEERKVVRPDGKVRCQGSLRKLISSGTRVSSSGTVVNTLTSPVTTTCRRFKNSVYYTEEEDPILIDENCKILGTIWIPVPEFKGFKRSVKEQFIFGLTEIKVKAVVEETGEIIDATFDLLE